MGLVFEERKEFRRSIERFVGVERGLLVMENLFVNTVGFDFFA